jgi:hypothetical protein
MSANWRNQVIAAANIVEAQYGEQVDLLPWQSEQQASFVEGGPDTTRSPAMDVRVLFYVRTSESDKVEMNAQIAQAEAFFVMRQSLVDDVQLTQGDRIRALEQNNNFYEVTFVGKSSVGRPRVYVVRIRDPHTV